MNSYLEWAIIALILAGIALAIWRGGAANPVSTGGLRLRLNALDGDMKALSTKVGTVETRVAELDQRAATKGDIERIEKRLAGWDPRMDRLDDRLDALERDIASMQTMQAANQRVVEAMAESLRANMDAIGKIERIVDANGVVTAQVPQFMEKVLTQVASTAAQTEAVCRQVDRLYDFITERGIAK
jgi:chromosome segregation ATPase